MDANMTTRRWILTLLIALAPAAGCAPTIEGSGNLVTEDRDIPDLQRISVCCGFEVQLEEGDEPSLQLTGDDNIVEAIEARKRGDTIEVDYGDESASYRPTERIRVEIVLTNVREFVGSGGVKFDASAIETDTLTATFSGGSVASFAAITADAFDLAASGGSEIDAAGEVDRQTINASGGSTYRASDLASKEASIQASGGSQVDVKVSDTLDANASGGSKITYVGDPSVDKTTSGGGSVRKK